LLNIGPKYKKKNLTHKFIHNISALYVEKYQNDILVHQKTCFEDRTANISHHFHMTKNNCKTQTPQSMQIISLLFFTLQKLRTSLTLKINFYLKSE